MLEGGSYGPVQLQTIFLSRPFTGHLLIQIDMILSTFFRS